MNSFDTSVLHFINAFIGRSWTLDAVMAYLVNTRIAGGVCMALFWWAWVKYEKERKQRALLVFSAVASVASVGVAGILGYILPFRTEPIFEPSLNLHAVETLLFNGHPKWSSFPSVNAAGFFCLAMGLWFVSRRLGAVVFCYALLIICIPRLYVSLNYPTDIVAGAALGIAIANLARIRGVRRSVTRPALECQQHYPAYFYVLLFAFTCAVPNLCQTLQDVWSLM